jgi:Fe-S-cluster containining protein
MTEQHNLPAPDEAIRQEYLELVGEIDLCVRELTEGRLSARIGCRPGCADCCMAFTVLPLEAALLAQALARRSLTVVRSPDRCRFLRDGLCAIYALRPVICRTQGLALAYIDEAAERIEVSACPLNFPEDALLEHDDLLFMDLFNERLAALNLRYCRLNGLAPERRVALADLLAPSA